MSEPSGSEPRRADELEGRTLGEFVLGEPIGEGGFGLVYRAEQTALQRQAVIKIHKLGASVQPGAVERFLAEARLASRIDHPFAAHVYAFGHEPDGLLWIAMELVRGTPLDRLLAEGGPMPVSRAVPLLRRLCEVVQTAHDQGIVHRDLKPQNVMVIERAGSMLPKLLDLGVARDLAAGPGAATPRSQIALGTPHYMAPELWTDADAAGPAADIYALGAIGYELVTGERPFRGGSLLEIASKHARMAPPPLPEPLPRALGDELARAMAKRPADRHPSAQALGDALVEAAGVALEAASLPALDDATRDEAMLRAPQPIAETVAALDAAQNVHQAREAVWQVTGVTASYAGLVTLACRAQAGPGRHDDSARARELIHQLSIGELATAQWWQLCRELCQPFALIPDAHPVPELVRLLFDGTAPLRTAMDELLELRSVEPGITASPGELREFLATAVARLGAALRALRFFDDARLVVPAARGAAVQAEAWMGVRRSRRPALAVDHALEVERPVLIDRRGNPAVSLWPLVQALAPSPNSPPELFLFAGRGRRGARLVASPVGFERGDPALPDWVARNLPAGDGAAREGEPVDAAPYRGLATFTADDADSFFGREREVDAFCNRLRTTPTLAVVGASGAGKSSFVQAGVLPAIGGGWRSLLVRPGPSPLSALAAQLRAAGVEVDREALATDPGELGRRLRDAAGGEGIVLVVDQFEELFTLCLDPAERDAYAGALAGAALGPDDPVRVIATLRDDFLARAAGLPRLRERLTGSLHVVTTPVADDLRRILVEPARRVGYDYEDPELIGEMVREVEDRPGALALLSFTAFQLWEFRDRQHRRLTRKAYRALGGVGGALAQHAEATMAELSPDEQGVVREAFRHLVTADGTRAVMSRAELFEVAGAEHAERVIEKLTTARLLTASEGPDGTDQIEIVHEALLTAWPRVVGWRHEDAQGARLRDQLRVAARQWADRDRPRGLLWRGDALGEYRLWRVRYPGQLTDVEEAFGRASVADAARGRRLRLLALGAVIAGLSIGLVVVTRLRGVAETNRALAQQQLIESFVEQGRRSLLESDMPGALLFLERALAGGADTPGVRYMIARALDPLGAEVATLRGHTGPLWEVAFLGDGGRVLTAGEDGTARIWNRRGDLLHKLAAAEGGQVVASPSPDGASVITGGSDGAIRLWDAGSGAERWAVPDAHAAPILSIQFSPDGSRLVTSAEDGSVRVLDAATGTLRAELLAPDPGERHAADVSADGRLIALSGNKGAATVWTWDGKRVAELRGHRDRIWYAVFDPAGKRVATASADNTARIWNAETGDVIQVLRGHDQRVTDVAWSPDGKRVATASADLTIKIWDPETGEVLVGLLGHAAQVNQITFAADGRELISIAADGTARVWDPARGLLLATFVHGGFVFALDVSPDGSVLATASWLGTAKLWRMDRKEIERSLVGPPPEGRPPYPLPQFSAGCNCAAQFAGDTAELWKLGDGSVRRFRAGGSIADNGLSLAGRGGRLAIGAADGRLQVFDVGGSDAARLDVEAHPGGVFAVALDAAGRRCASAGSDGAVALWEVDTGKLLVRRAIAGPIKTLMWSPDETRLVAFDDSMETRGEGALLDARSLEPIADLGAIQTATFAPDGRVVTSATDAAIHIWSARGEPVRRLDHKSTPSVPAFTASGDQLLVGMSDGGIQVWDTATWSSLGRIAAHDFVVVGLAVSPDGKLAGSLSFDSTVKVWDLASLRLVHSVRVAPGSDWLAYDPAGPRWLIGSGGQIDLRSASRSDLGATELAALLRCRLPFRLEGVTVVPSDLPADCN